MSIKYALLAVLSDGSAGAYRLREEFERRTGGTWPLNMGQVSTTLDRLVRDGLIAVSDGDRDVPQYALSETGRAELRRWWIGPVDRSTPAREELAMKLALAVTVAGVDVRAVVQNQRAETVRSMQAMTRLKADLPDGDLAWALVVEHLIFAAEAEARWLDHVEARVMRASAAQGVADAPTSAAANVGSSVGGAR